MRERERERAMLANESGVSSFDLPEEVLEVLPLDPFEQLDVARKITSIALSTRVSFLESESSSLRAKLAEKDHLIAHLQSQLDSLDASLSDTADKLAQADTEKVPTLFFFLYSVLFFSLPFSSLSLSLILFAGAIVERERFAF